MAGFLGGLPGGDGGGGGGGVGVPGGPPPGGGGGGTIDPLGQPACGQNITFTPTGGTPITFNFPCSGAQGKLTFRDIDDLINKIGIVAAIAQLGATITSGFLPSQNPPDQGGSNGQEIDQIIVNVPPIVNNINADISQAVQQIADEQKDTLQKLGDNITGAVNSIFGKVGDILKQIGDTIWDAIKTAASAVATQLANIFSGVWEKLDKAVSDIANKIGPIFVAIKDQLDTITKTIQDINDRIIAPIVNTVTQTYNAVNNLINAIHTDLKEGLSGLVKLPGQISDALTSIDASVGRAIQEINAANKANIDSAVKGVSDAIGSQLPSALADKLKIVGNTKDLKPELQDTVRLQDEDAGAQFIEALQKFVSKWSVVETIGSDLIKWVMDFWGVLGAVLGIAKITDERVEEYLREQFHFTKLEVEYALEAWKRGIIDNESLNIDLAAKGYDAGRIKVMRDLRVYLEDPNMAIEQFWRGLIDQTTLEQILSKNGYTLDQIKAAELQSEHLPQADELIRWYRWGKIDLATLEAGLQSLRYTDEQVKNVVDTMVSWTPTAAKAHIDGLLNASIQGYLRNSLGSPIPDPVQAAGTKEGLSQDAIEYLWLTHWTRPPIQMWLQSYYRGLRTRSEVEHALQADNWPSEFWDDVIQVNRPLIPFRTIPSMVAAGIITETQARTLLGKHGFDDQSVNWLIAYATRSKQATAATTATKLQEVSIATATELYKDGALTQDELAKILVQHNYDDNAVKLTIEAIDLQHQAAERKAALQFTIDTVVLGQATVDDALAQLSAAGFSDIEIARAQRAMAQQRAKTAKLPSLGDLKQMRAHDIIDDTTYLDTVKQLGYDAVWAQRFLDLLHAPTSKTPTGSTP